MRGKYIEAEFTLNGFRRHVSMPVDTFEAIRTWLTEYRHSKKNDRPVRNADIARTYTALTQLTELDPSLRYHLRSLVCQQWKVPAGALVHCWTNYLAQADGVIQLTLKL